MSLKPRVTKGALEAREKFRDALVEWFSENAMDYPWRRTREPYEILISEVMLQQTQIASVLGRGYYRRFIEAFPNVECLAAAEDEPLLKAWEGLGYYRRARMLRATARAVIAAHGGHFPKALDELLKLPGVGPYTAGALRAFAHELPAVLVDGNVARVLSRVMDFSEEADGSAGQKQLWQWAEALADSARPRLYHSALMELGQKICRPGVPDCLACPVARFCLTREPEKQPVKRPKPAITEVDEHALWLVDPQGRLLLHQETAGKRREGLWKLPTREASQFELLSPPLLAVQKYAITRYRVTLNVYDASPLKKKFRPEPGELWIPREEVLALAMPSPYRRVIEKLLAER
jgi:A/G-specific adenine glycosylase